MYVIGQQILENSVKKGSHIPGRYIGTFQLHDGDLVYHLFEEDRV